LGGPALAKRDATREFAVQAARTCGDERCTNVIVLDLRDLSGVADYFVIATGSSDRQIRTAAEQVLGLGKEQGRRPLGVDGVQYSHWVLIDYGDVVVHVFAPDYREIYDLELLWGDAPRVRWERRTASKPSE